MPTITFYDKGCTKKIRIRHKWDLNTYLGRAESVDIQVEGCIITQSTGYFDFKKPLALESFSIQKYSYIKYVAEKGTSPYVTYFMFVDRIEVNNFNENSEYYRCYFTVDWWSTLHWNEFDFSSKFEGVVERAHIDDVHYSEDLGYFIADLTHTSTEAEEDITKEQIEVFQLPNVIEDITWAYVITNSAYENGAPKFDWTLYPLRNKLSISNTPCVVYPIKNGLVVPFRIKPNAPSDYVNIDGGFPISEITDKEVLGIFYSKIPPSKNIDYAPNTDYPIIINWNSINASLRYLEIGGITTPQSDKKGIVFDIINNTSFTIDDIMANKTLFKSNEFYKPNTYAEYLMNNIVKFHSSTYKPIIYRSGYEAHIIDNMYLIKDSPIYCTVNLSTGGTFLSYPNLLRNDMSVSTYSIGENMIFQPTRSVDKFELTSAILGVGSSITANIVSKILTDKGTVIAKGGILGIMSALRGQLNSVATPQQHDYRTSETNIVYSIPLNFLNILEHLALYGYYTDLHPNDVINGHIRKYFNYIKTTNCVCLDNRFNEEIRKDLENMFNSGVWLWNTPDEFGNFEVPNYPILFEGYLNGGDVI